MSLCVPSRGRPERFQQMVRSATITARGPIEFCVWLDEDDDTAPRYPRGPHIRYGSGERPYVDGSLCTSGLWSKAWELASGEIAMLGADDIIFRTPGWDTKVTEAFDAVVDRIVMVYGDDQSRRKAPVNPFLHRRWIEAAGFTQPDWQGWMADEEIWTLAAILGRVVFLPDVRIVHVQRRGSDATYREGEAAREAVGGVVGMRERFYSPAKVARRNDQLAKLGALKIDDELMLPEPYPPWLTESLERSMAAAR